MSPEPDSAVTAAPADPLATEEVIHSLPTVVKETKAGYKTTEFYVGIVAAVLDVVTQIPFHDKLVLSIVAGVYAVARGLAKSGVPNVEAQ